MRSLSLAWVLAACSASPTTVEITLAPDLISSLDGTTEISALVAADSVPLDGVAVTATIDYTDRNGTAHMIMPLAGTTDKRGVFHAQVTGLSWDGTGKVTVAVDSAVSGDATFAVLDRTPPKLTILPPTTDLRVGPGLPLDVQVQVSDEIGISEVVIDGTGGINGTRQTVIPSGAVDTTMTFRMSIPIGVAAGPNVVLHALATDLSGNSAAANAMTLVVDPSITIATPPGLAGSLLVDGTAQQLVDPRAIVTSPKDGHLYVADVARTGACNPSCVWRVDPATGAIDATPVFVATGTAQGLAVDATGDHLYISDAQNRVVQLTYSGTAYGAPAVCDNVAQQQPQDPVHLVVDATLGILVVDGNNKDVQKLTSCATTSVGQAMSMNGNFDDPRGIGLDPAGAIYVSDFNRDRVSKVDRASGAVTAFGAASSPWGVEWLAGGTTPYADTLMIAANGDRIVEALKAGAAPLAAAYLRNNPVDLAFIAGTMFVATGPSGNNRGRIYKITGF